MNKVLLLGRLTKEPEIKYSEATQTKIAKFTLAVNRKYVKQGEERQADFFNIVIYSKLADFVEKYLNTGIQINVVGRLQNRNWTDEAGTKHYITEIVGEEIYFADTQKKDSDKSLTNNTEESASDENVVCDDDLPF